MKLQHSRVSEIPHLWKPLSCEFCRHGHPGAISFVALFMNFRQGFPAAELQGKGYRLFFCFLFLFNPHPRTCFQCFQRERKGARETSMQERSIDRLPSHTRRTREHNRTDWESNLQFFSYGMTLQPTESHWPGQGIDSSEGFSYVLLSCHLEI